MRKYFKFLFLSFLSLVVLVVVGIGFVSPDVGLANNRRFLVDRVIDNSTSDEPSIGLTGVHGSNGETSSDLCLKNSDNLAWLSCNNSPVFTSFGYPSNSSVIKRYGRYKNAASASVFYQYRLGGRDDLSRLNGGSKSHPMSDAYFTPERADKLYLGLTLMARVLKARETGLFRCAADRTRSQIPSRYLALLSSHGRNIFGKPFPGDVSVRKLKRSIAIADIRELMSERSYIAIGAYDQSLSPGKDASGAFTYSKPLARVQSTNSKLLGLSFNVNYLDQISPQEVASVLFHELMHNLGFGHTSNDPESYKDRSVAILALEDCMKAEAEQIKPLCFAGDSPTPVDCGAPSRPIDGNID